MEFVLRDVDPGDIRDVIGISSGGLRIWWSAELWFRDVSDCFDHAVFMRI